MNGLFWPGWLLFIVIWPIPSTRAETDPAFVEDSKTLEIPLQDYGESSTHCGLHALRAVANALDRPIPVDLLFCDGQFMSDAKGSSSNDLLMAARANALGVRIIEGVSIGDLYNSTVPALLLMDTEASEFKHWIAYLGKSSNGRIEIYDSDIGIVSKDPSELDSFWGGTCLLVGQSDKQVDSAAFSVAMTSVLRKLIYLLAAIAIVLLVERIMLHFSMRFSHSRGIWILVVSAASSALLLITEHDPRALHDTLVSRNCWSAKITGQTESKSDYIREIPSDANVLLVDCRMAVDYRSGHIPNAINIPSNSGFHTWFQFVKTLSKDRHVVLYCKSAKCDWAEITRRRLQCLGVKASVLSGGYDRFTTEAMGGLDHVQSVQQGS
ncbi:MAG: rhodanese-like domain-containing protein [Planctomycetota bacterium]|jgi:rhodanese-related sulfurtransferase